MGALVVINESTPKRYGRSIPVLGREIRSSYDRLKPGSLLLSGPSLREALWLRQRFGSRPDCYDREGPKNTY